MFILWMKMIFLFYFLFRFRFAQFHFLISDFVDKRSAFTFWYSQVFAPARMHAM